MNAASARGNSCRTAKRPRVSLAPAQHVEVHSPARPAMVYSSLPFLAECALQFHSFDAKYIDNLCTGDGQTQEHFVRYFTELLKLKLRSRLQSPHAIEDVCQETFARVLSVLRRDGGLRQPERLGAFVNTTCNHVLFEEYRSSRRSDSLDEEGKPEPAAKGANALDMAASKQIGKKVREILLELAPRDRSLLKAVFLEERPRRGVPRVRRRAGVPAGSAPPGEAGVQD